MYQNSRTKPHDDQSFHDTKFRLMLFDRVRKLEAGTVR